MVDASVVNAIWPEVEALRGVLSQSEPPALLEALFVADDGDWRLAAVMPNVETVGTRPIYAALDTLAEAAGIEVGLLSRLAVLDVGDADAAGLAYAPVHRERPPRTLDQDLPSLPGYAGAVLHRVAGSPGALRTYALTEEVSSALVSEGFDPQPARSDFRADLIIQQGDDRRVLIEVKSTLGNNLRNHILECAGLANVQGWPVILVYVLRGTLRRQLDESYGVIPLLPVDWEQDGIDGLRRALTQAFDWHLPR